MKRIAYFISLVFIPFLSWSQSDSIELEVQKMQLEIMKQELQMKKQELDMKIDDNKDYKEDRQERKTREKEERITAKNDRDRLNGLMESGTNIFINPLALFVGGFEVGVEKRVDKKKSLRFCAGYYYSEAPWYYRDASEMQGAKLSLQYRAYLQDFRPGMFGLYVGPEATFKTISYRQTLYTFDPYTYNVTSRDTLQEAMAGSIGFVCGFQGLLFKRMTIDASFGANLILPVSSYESTDISLPLVNPYGKGAHPKFALSIGVPF